MKHEYTKGLMVAQKFNYNLPQKTKFKKSFTELFMQLPLKYINNEPHFGFVGVKVFGRQHQYYPLLSKDAYSKASMKSLVKSYFGGSFSEAVSFMVKENTISLEDLETLLQQLKKAKK